MLFCRPLLGSHFYLQANCDAVVRKESPRKLSVSEGFLVRVVGLEPTHQWYRNLNPARLPIPPYPLISSASNHYSTLVGLEQ